MSPERLERVKEVLDEALELAPEERAAFLGKFSADDQALRQEVESLLAFEDTERPWREGPIVSLFEPHAGLRPDQRIGPYRVVRVIGEGGMGTVALAVRQDDFEKKVALKIVPPHRRSAELVRRFHNERQLLAHLEHPNISRILDGGTTDDGQPFFVMEYVEGEPIDLWCASRQLSIRQRLELFLPVASAIQLAHRNLIVHRDLKPSNILVTSAGVPKLLDFGIAKQMAPEAHSQLTRLTQRPMTLRYASPEQIAGRPITTSSDVYSLGLLLYQLLTGRYPFASEGDSDLELAQAIRDSEPRRPSTTVGSSRSERRRLAGDLDSIVLKAMRKEPEHRYDSVEQLADDVRRYLSGRTVIARKGTWSYRAAKFIRLHKLPLAAFSALVGLSLAFGITATILWQRAVVARKDAEVAEKEAVHGREQAEDVLGFMKELFRDSDPNRSGSEELTARELLDRAEKRIETLDDPLLRAELLATIGEIYAHLGNLERAGGAWEVAELLLRRHFSGDHPKLAKAINNLAGSLLHRGDYRQAERLYREALAMKQGLPDAQDVDLAKTISNLATSLLYLGDYREAEGLYRRALEMRRGENRPDHPSVANTLHNLGVLYYTVGDLSRSEPLLQEALAIREHTYGLENTRVASALTSLGRLLHARGKHAEAEDLYVKALRIRLVLGVEDSSAGALNTLDLGQLHLDTGRLETAEPLVVEALEILRRKKPPAAWEIARAESVFGACLVQRGRYQDAEEKLLGSYRRLAEARGKQTIHTRDARRRLAKLYDAWGKPEQAATYRDRSE